MDEIRWGIIGSGNIAHKFAEDIKLVDHCRVVACSSKDIDKARDFKDRHGLDFSYGSYEEMLDNPLIDAVYIATTHNYHHENALLCIRYGKHILCEKAFTLNAGQAAEIFAEAGKKGLFVMEAMWSRFLPAAVWMREQILKGEIGRITGISARFGVKFPYDPGSRAFDRNLGGGGLLDLGIYPLSLACSIMGGTPDEIIGNAAIGATGVDEQGSILLKYAGGRIASLAYSMLEEYENLATVFGTKGRIMVEQTFKPVKITIIKENEPDILFESSGTNGFEHEIREAVDLILQGKTGSAVMSAEDTIRIMRICDALRAQWNMKYPGE
ncbi:MAG: Gfo/Idh/MocA family protein [Saccharofermentanales bacterium]